MTKRYFQWIDGEDFGMVEVLDKIRYEKGEYFFDFISGESMNMRFIAAQTNDVAAIKGKMMVEIQDPYDKWTAKEIKNRVEKVDTPDRGEVTVEIPCLDDYVSADAGGNIASSAVGTKRFTAPRFRGPFKPLPDPSEYMKSETPEIVVTNKPTQAEVKSSSSSFICSPDSVEETVEEPKKIVVKNAPKNETDPVYILVNSSKKEEKSVDITLNLNLPSKDLYKIVSNQFEDGKNKFIDCITNILSDSLTSEEVLNTLKDSIIEAYEAE